MDLHPPDVGSQQMDEPDDKGSQDGIGGGGGHGLCAGGHQPYQQDQRQDQINVSEQIAPLGQLRAGNTLQAQALCLQMDGNENAGEVQNSGEDGLHSYLRIGQIHVFRHQEGSGAHDGRHDLSAGGGGRFHRAGKLGLVAGLLHHGDGHGAGGHGVAHGGAGHHAAQGGGNDGHLGGTAAGPAGHAVCKVNEEAGDAGALQERAENDEQNDVSEAHIDGRANDAGGGVEQLIHHVLQGVIEAGVVAELIIESVDQQSAYHAQNGDAHAAAAQLHQHQNADDADDHMDGLNAGGQLDKRQCIEGKVEEAACAHYHQHDVVPGQGVDLHMAFLGRVGQKAQDNDAAHKQGQAHLGQGGGKQGHIQAVQGENRHDHRDDDLGYALPYAGGGLTVILAHDLVQIGLHIAAAVSGGSGIHRGSRLVLFLKDAQGERPPFLL